METLLYPVIMYIGITEYTHWALYTLGFVLIIFWSTYSRRNKKSLWYDNDIVNFVMVFCGVAIALIKVINYDSILQLCYLLVTIIALLYLYIRHLIDKRKEEQSNGKL